MTLKTTIALLGLFALSPVCSGHVCTGDQEFLAEEDDPLTLSCDVATNSTLMIWSWSFDGQVFDVLAFCSPFNGSCSPTFPQKDEDHRLDNTKLIIKLNLFSRVARTVECAYVDFRSGLSMSKQHCRIRVKYPADKIQNCTVQRNFTDLSLSGSCDVEKINSSDGLHQCRWKHRVGNETVWEDTRGAATLGDGGSIRCGFHGYHVNASHESGDFTLWIDRGRGWYYGASVPFSGLQSATDSTTNAVTDTIAVTDTENANNDSTPPAVTTAVIAVIVLIIVVVVVTIATIVKQRKGSEKRMTTTVTSSALDRDNDFVEFINDSYGDVEQSQPPNPVPAPANALGFSSNENAAAASSSPPGDEAADLQSRPPTSRDRAATNQNADTDLYSTDDPDYIMCDLQGSGTQSPTLNLPAGSGSKPSPSTKPKSKKTNHQAVDPKPRPETHQTPDPDQSRGENARTQDAPAKRSKRAGHKRTEAEGEARAQVRKPKSAATKRKKKVTGAGTTVATASAHPGVCVRPEATARAYENVGSSDQGTQPKEVTSAADCDDEYSALNFHRRPANESARAQEALYSHTCTTAVQKKS